MTTRDAAQVAGEIERVCRDLAAQCQGTFSWEWDDRFAAALTVARGAAQSDLQAHAAAALPSVWDHQSIAGAPERLVRLSEAWGMRPGQKLMSLNATDDPLLVGAWWPWGGGGTVSLRICCVPHGPEAALVAPPELLKNYFGL